MAGPPHAWRCAAAPSVRGADSDGATLSRRQRAATGSPIIFTCARVLRGIRLTPRVGSGSMLQ